MGPNQNTRQQSPAYEHLLTLRTSTLEDNFLLAHSQGTREENYNYYINLPTHSASLIDDILYFQQQKTKQSFGIHRSSHLLSCIFPDNSLR